MIALSDSVPEQLVAAETALSLERAHNPTRAASHTEAEAKETSSDLSTDSATPAVTMTTKRL
jgi:hypothetical protein